MRRDDATTSMMKDVDHKHAGALVADKHSRFGDRRYMNVVDYKSKIESSRAGAAAQGRRTGPLSNNAVCACG